MSYRISSTTDLSRVRTTAGDYNLKDLSAAVNNEERNNLIVETYLRKFHGKQALVFATDLDHVERLTEQFNKVDVKTASVTGDLDKNIRRGVIEDFKSGKIQIVVNYGCLTEGFDHDALSVIIMARPTQSPLLLTQCIGRGNRLHKSKVLNEVVEIVDYHSEKTATVASLFSFKKVFDCEGHNFLECTDKAIELQNQLPSYNPYSTSSWTEMCAKFQMMKEAQERIKREALERKESGGEREVTQYQDLFFQHLDLTEFYDNRYCFTVVGIRKTDHEFHNGREEVPFEYL